MEKAIAASVMCADFLHLADTVEALRRAGVSFLHFDIMDGEFVPNYTLGACLMQALRASGMTFDIHAMVVRPEDKLAYLDIRAGDWVSVHAEATAHLQRVLARIRDAGAKAGVALNPATPLTVLDHVMGDIDYALVMTVNPGFAGQKLVPATIGKIAQLRQKLDDAGYAHVPIEVDGNVSWENARKMSRAGADIFVAGTAGLFLPDMGLEEAARELLGAMRG